MTTGSRRVLCVSVLVSLLATTGFGQSYAVKDGYWNVPSTWKNGLVPDAAKVANIGTYSGATTATVTLSADQSVASLYLGAEWTTRGTLDLGDHNLAVGNTLQIGYHNNYGGTGIVKRGAGSLTAHMLAIYWGNDFTFGEHDAVGVLKLKGANATTAGSANVKWARLENNAKLTLGADMLAGDFISYSRTTLDMRSHALTATDYIKLEGYLGGGMTIENRGAMRTKKLQVLDHTFNFEAADSTNRLELFRVSSATASTANISETVSLNNGCKLTLGDDLSLSDVVQVRDASIVDALRHDITAKGIYLGTDGARATSLVNGGAVYVNDLQMTKGSTATFHAAGSIEKAISLAGGSELTLEQSKGDLTGLTFNGTSSGSLAIADTSKLVLDFGDNDRPSWIFRWKDPDGGTWEGLLASLIGDGKISVTGYRLYDEGGYTYHRQRRARARHAGRPAATGRHCRGGGRVASPPARVTTNPPHLDRCSPRKHRDPAHSPNPQSPIAYSLPSACGLAARRGDRRRIVAIGRACGCPGGNSGCCPGCQDPGAGGGLGETPLRRLGGLAGAAEDGGQEPSGVAGGVHDPRPVAGQCQRTCPCAGDVAAGGCRGAGGRRAVLGAGADGAGRAVDCRGRPAVGEGPGVGRGGEGPGPAERRPAAIAHRPGDALRVAQAVACCAEATRGGAGRRPGTCSRASGPGPRVVSAEEVRRVDRRVPQGRRGRQEPGAGRGGRGRALPGGRRRRGGQPLDARGDQARPDGHQDPAGRGHVVAQRGQAGSGGRASGRGAFDRARLAPGPDGPRHGGAVQEGLRGRREAVPGSAPPRRPI